MASICIKCKKCGSSNLKVRTSQRVTANTVATEAFCQSCFTQNTIHSEIVRVRIPLFKECAEALKHDKPFDEVNPNQIEIPTE